MSELKIQLQLNGGNELLELKGRENLSKKLFDYLINRTTIFKLNDNGKRFDMEKQLQPFIAGEPTEDMWSYEINDESIEIIKELFDKLEHAPHTKWGLHGEEISLEYKEQGETKQEEGVVECFTILTGGRNLEKITKLIYTDSN